MRNPDDEGYVTLHRGRAPILQRVAMVLMLACVWGFFWKVVGAHEGNGIADIQSGAVTIQSGSIATGTISTGFVLQGRCPADRVPVIVGADMTKPCPQNICQLVVYKCAIPADLTDQE